MKTSFLLIVLFSMSSCSDQVAMNDMGRKVMPEKDSTGAKLLKKNCSQCHGAPHPTDHVAEHWPNVIERMQTHMIKNAYNPLSAEDKHNIITYLQKHAAK